MSEGVREIRGTVMRLFTQNPNFCAGELLPAKEDVTRRGAIRFAGRVFVREGEYVTLKGQFVDDPKWGRQLRVDARVHTDGMDKAGLAAWLAVHGSAVGIGVVKAEKIANEFGDNFTGILRDNPEQVAVFARVPLEYVKRLAESWCEHEEMNALGTKLMAYELTAHQVAALYQKFKGSVVALLQEDPYLLLGEVDGLGFKKVDEIARKLGIPEDHPGRLRAAAIHALVQARDDGHTCLSAGVVVEISVELLELHREDGETLVAGRIEQLATDEQKLREASEGGPEGRRWYALPSCWRHEKAVAAFLRQASGENPHLARLLSDEPPERYEDFDADGDGGDDNDGECDQKPLAAYSTPAELIAEFCPELDESQRRAATSAVRNRACLISGGAGSGKTTLIRSIVEVYNRVGLRVALCAPTGKAARRLEEVVDGSRASTIHRLLEYHPKMGGFQRDADNPIDANVVIVDEASMLESALAACLFDAVGPKTSVVLVGDHHQLPPVGPGALLRDCIQHELLPLTLLNQCHRQAGALKRNAAAVLLGNVAPTVRPGQEGWDGSGPGPWYVHERLTTPGQVVECVERLFREVLAGKWGYDLLTDVQFLTPQHGGPLGTRALNVLLQRLHQASLGVTVEPVLPDQRPKLHVGDKVIQTKNNYNIDVMNGHQGSVLSLKPLTVDFDGRVVVIPNESKGEIELAYCLTAHKVQGSEFPCVVVVCHKQHSYMLHRNWLYTAVTRARRTCVILGDDAGMRRAARTVKANERQTLLGLFARGVGHDVP